MRTTLSSAVESSGSIAAQDDAALSFRTGGSVAQVNVDAGQHVKTGYVDEAMGMRLSRADMAEFMAAML